MRLERVWVDGWHNLRDVKVDFDETRLTTVLIGQNGTGKSNLLEAITYVFRNADLNVEPPPFSFEVAYRIDNSAVTIAGKSGQWTFTADGKPISRTEFQRRKVELFPDLIFGYYSGDNNRLESLFDAHQRRYYGKIIKEEAKSEVRTSIEDRRLFYCRPIHGVLALLSFFAFPDSKICDLLESLMGVRGFHSAFVAFREPWFAKSRNSKSSPPEFWGAAGRPGQCAGFLRDVAFFPFSRKVREIDDYREKGSDEEQYYVYLRNEDALCKFASHFKDDLELFEALESVDISDLIRWVQVWVTRRDDASGDISFGDLSDGERQLLMVLGLIRLSRGKRALFLLDEPDTHLNPEWQHKYLELIRTWAEADAAKCQFLIATHHPLTIAALEKEEVRVMYEDANGQVRAKAPFIDPKGLGVSGVLTDVFGMASTLDKPTQELIDERNVLARLEKLSRVQSKKLEEINARLHQIGLLYEERDQLYGLFLRKLDEVELSDAGPLTPDQLANREEATKEIISELLKSQ
jgi:predicted ATPase